MRYSEAPARRDELLRRLERDGYVASALVAEEFGVSEMTIRRDLRQLHLEGLARRVVGGASRSPAPSGDIPFEVRDRHATAEKERLARYCADLLGGSGIVALDAGTTVGAIARRIGAGATIVSHSIPVIRAASDRADIELIALGGAFDRATRSFSGATAREGLRRVAIDVAVVAATAVDFSGLMCSSEADAEMKAAMIAAADRTVLVVTRDKLGARAAHRFGSLDQIDVAVTSGPLDHEHMRMLGGAAEVHLVEMGPGTASRLITS